jgi:hypothetical protein
VWSVDRSARRVVEGGARWPEEFNIDRVLCIVFFLPVPGVSGSCNVCDRWHVRPTHYTPVSNSTLESTSVPASSRARPTCDTTSLESRRMIGQDSAVVE